MSSLFASAPTTPAQLLLLPACATLIARLQMLPLAADSFDSLKVKLTPRFRRADIVACRFEAGDRSKEIAHG